MAGAGEAALLRDLPHCLVRACEQPLHLFQSSLAQNGMNRCPQQFAKAQIKDAARDAKRPSQAPSMRKELRD